MGWHPTRGHTTLGKQGHDIKGRLKKGTLLFLIGMALSVPARVRQADAQSQQHIPFRLLEYSQDHRNLQLDKNFIAETLTIGSQTYKRGLGTHSNCRMAIRLEKDCKTFLAHAGSDLNEPTRKAGGSVVFVIKTDGKERFRSKVLHPGDSAVPVRVDLTGATKLDMLVTDAGDGFIGDHADWADARIVLADGREIFLSHAFRSQGLPPNRRSSRPTPFTEPETRTLTAEEADRLLEAEWLFQADNAPDAAKARAEILYAREIAARLAKRPDAPDTVVELSELTRHERELAAPGADARAVYLAVRRVKRRIMFKDPLVDFAQLVFIDVPERYPHESMHRVYPQAQLNCVRLLVLDGLHPGGKLRKLTEELGPGWYWRPEVSFDAQRVLFCFRPKKDRTFHLYEVGLSGVGVKQLTFGNYDDMDPIYMPDGHIVFVSSRGHSHARCVVGHPSTVVTRCDADGRNIYFISAGNEPEYTPALMPNGQILYTRWEYTDKELMRIQSLWLTNPDGTGTRVYWGNQSYWPDMLLEARPIPGSHRVMFAGHGHHQVYRGSIGIVDQRKGFNYPDGLTKVTWDVPWCEVGDGPSETPETREYHRSGKYNGYKSPYPLSEELFLVSARAAGRNSKFKLFLMDVYGNRELVYEGAYHALYAMPVRPRPKPAAIPDQIAWAGAQKDRAPVKPGTFYCPDVYAGAPEVLRNKARFLRVLNLEWNTATLGKKIQDVEHTRESPHMHVGPVVSITVNDGVKRVLGTVPVEADGSVYFEAPPCRALHFQLLDENHLALHTMRSFTSVMPGEQRGCVGCHESQRATPQARPTIALDKGPAKIAPYPMGPVHSLGYERDIQPILDKHCGACHQGNGKGRAKLDLALRPSPDAGVFPEPYVTLTLGKKRDLRGHFPSNCEGGIAGAIMAENRPWRPEDYGTFPPMKALSYGSKLIEIARSGKHPPSRGTAAEPAKVKMDRESLLKLILWVDTMCPYRGERELRAMEDPDPEHPIFKRSNYPPSDPTITDVYAQSPYRPRMRTAPLVNRAYRQDEFPTTESRLPRDSSGTILPPVEFLADGTRVERWSDGVSIE